MVFDYRGSNGTIYFSLRPAQYLQTEHPEAKTGDLTVKTGSDAKIKDVIQSGMVENHFITLVCFSIRQLFNELLAILANFEKFQISD